MTKLAGRPSGVGRDALLLASDDTAGVTGEVLHVDAGVHVEGPVTSLPGPARRPDPQGTGGDAPTRQSRRAVPAREGRADEP